MDVISALASITGLLAVAAKTISVSANFIRKEKNAPKSMHNIVKEVSDLHICLARLLPFIQGIEDAPKARKAAISVEDIIVISTSCIIAMSDLEEVLDSYKLDQPMPTKTKIRWAMEEQRIADILARVRVSKSSLSLVLNIMTCISVQELHSSIGRLTNAVQYILENSEEVSRRLASIEPEIASLIQRTPSTRRSLPDASYRPSTAVSTVHDIVDDTSTVLPIPPEAIQFGPNIELELSKSRPYLRTAHRHSTSSLPSGAESALGWSFFANVTLADISEISVISLPISYDEIWNAEHYQPPHDLFSTVSIAPTRSANRQAKILLLGPGESGKSTVYKQIRIAYGNTFSLNERKEIGSIILLNALFTFQHIFGEMRASGLHYRRGDSLIYENVVQSASIPVSAKRSFPQKVMFAIKGLLDDESIQEIIARRHQYGLRDNFLYYCRNINRLCLKDYLPTDQDILHSRGSTTGCISTHYQIEDLNLQVVDCGGARAERKNWATQFQDTRCLLFTVPLTGYDFSDFSVAEDETKSQFQEALLLFESILSLSWFKRTSIILLFTKLDVFEEKCKTQPLSSYFPDYDGSDNDSDTALIFLASKFLNLVQKGDSRVETHFIEATHTKQVQMFLRSVKETIKKHPPRPMFKALQLEWSLDDFSQDFPYAQSIRNPRPNSKLLSSQQGSSNGLQKLGIVAPASFGDFSYAD